MATQNIGLSAQVTTTALTQAITAAYTGLGAPLGYSLPTSGVMLVNVGGGGAQYRIDSGDWIVLDKNEGNYIPADLSVNKVAVKLINDGSASTKLEYVVESMPTAYIGGTGETFPVANPPVTISGYRYSAAVATAVPGTGYTFNAGQWYRNGGAISGQTALTYMRTDTDIGTVLTFVPAGIAYSASGGTTLPTLIDPSEITPSAPVITAVTGFNNRVMVNMIAPVTGVAAQYRLTASTGQTVTVAANGLPYQAATLTGLTNGSAVTIQAQAIAAGNSTSALSAASASVTPVASRQISVAGNTFIPDGKHATNTQSMNVSFYTAARDITTLGVEFPGWYIANRTETNNTGTETWEADVTWNGNVTRITFGGGNNSGTVAPGANLKSDETTLGFTIPAGAEFSVGCYCTTTGQITFFQWYAADGKARGAYGTSGVTNLVGVLDKSAIPLITSTPTVGGFVRTPSAIFSTADGPAVALAIDSNSVGRGDTGDNTHSQGHLGRALRLANIPYMHVGVSGDQLSGSGNGWLASSAKRIALAKRYSTHALAEPAINDLTSGRTAAQVVADRLTFKNLWGATYPIAFTTLMPVTSGDFTTIAGQTPSAASAEIQAYNTSTLAGVAGAIAIFDVSLMSSAPGDRTRWNVGAGAVSYTVEGTHFNQAGALFVASQLAAQMSMIVG